MSKFRLFLKTSAPGTNWPEKKEITKEGRDLLFQKSILARLWCDDDMQNKPFDSMFGLCVCG
jgi:hypothetical protein